MPATSPHLMANGTIRPSRFVQLDPAADHKGIEGTANAPVIGIAQESSNYAPLSNLAIVVTAALVGEYFKLYGSGEQCLVEAGLLITIGDKLKSDATGRATPIVGAAGLQHWGAVALQSAAAAGELIPVQVLPLMSEIP